jgi:peptidyl-Asp metalloendopeptidase
MKLRVGACALMLVLAGCSGESPESGMAGMRDVAASKATGKLPASLPLARAVGASIANAPDRGALVRYADQKVAPSEGAFTYYPVAISEEHALKAIVTGEMTVPSPDGSSVKLRYERHDEHADGNWTWIGRVVGGDDRQEALITFGEKAVFGSIPQRNGAAPLELITKGGKLLVSVMDPSKASRAISEDGDTLIPPTAASRILSSAAVQSAVPQNAVAVGAPPTAANTIDLAIGYSSGLAARIGSDSGAVTRMVNLVGFANEALRNSDVNGYFRLVHAVKIAYTDTTTNLDTLQKLTGNTGSATVTVPTELAPLRTARDQYGADLAILVRDFKTPEHDGCGIAWLNGANKTAIDPAVDAAWAYAVVSDGEDKGSDGKDYFCAVETLAHESAHLMGSAHDRANSRDGNNLRYGAFDYSFGYKTAASNGNFYTVMAYGDTGQLAQRIFSTPLKSVCGPGANLPCGVANSEDNARSLNQTIPIVARFRATVVPHTSRARNDVNGDGYSDILWRNAAAQQFSHWAMNGSSIVGSAAKGMISSYYVAGTGDFNGDGLADILWKNDAARYLIIWQADGSGGYSQLEIGGYLPNLTFAGIGDFNDDGRADILWHDKAAGQVFYWAMNGRTPTQSASYPMPGWLDIIGVGDFNGDGAADLAYADASDVNLYLNNGAGTGFRGVRLAYRPTGWTLLGIADANGDDVSDFFWRNNTSGAMTIWGISNGVVTSTPSYTPSTVLTFAALGDFNGDGRADILWDRREWRQLSVWLSTTSSSYTGAVVGTYPVGWQALP